MIEQLALILAANVLLAALFELRYLRRQDAAKWLRVACLHWEQKAAEAEEDARSYCAAHQRELQACADAYAALEACRRELAAYQRAQRDDGREVS